MIKGFRSSFHQVNVWKDNLSNCKELKWCIYKSRLYSVSVKKAAEKSPGNDLFQKIIYNSVIESVDQRAGYLEKKKFYREFSRSENVLSNSRAKSSAVFLKYLTEDSQTEEVEEVTPIISGDASQSSVPSIHFPYQAKSRKLLEAEVVDSGDDLNVDSPPVSHYNWTNLKKIKLANQNLMNSMQRMDDDPALHHDRLENVSSDESVEMGNAYGTADPRIPASTVPCGGCGAHLHCQDTSIPGFIPMEIFKGLRIQDLRSVTCQRCHFLKNYDTALGVSVLAEEYPKILSHIKNEQALVILMVDLLDFPCSVWPDLLSIIGYKRPIVVVGNKIDLVVQDSKRFINHVTELLVDTLEQRGINRANVKHVALISAKTGYGVEALITKLHNNWQYQGDVYIMGCTNVGKSTLFNTLIQSDYCKVKAVDVMQRATTSRWPGTTMNLLKFPILRPSSWRLYVRTQRLISERSRNAAYDTIRARTLGSSKYKKQISFMGYIGRSFTPKSEIENTTDPFSQSVSGQDKLTGLDPTDEEYVTSKWCYDTPGAVQPEQILDLMTTAELVDTLPRQMVLPRNFHIRRGMSIFIGGIARIDFLDGPPFAWFTVFASDRLPVTVTLIEDADHVYTQLQGTEFLRVPTGSMERLSRWPALAAKHVLVHGRSFKETSADVVLSSAGWVAVTVKPEEVATLAAWTPQARGIHLRIPPIVTKAHYFRGQRLGKTPAYSINLKLDDEFELEQMN